MSLQCYNKGCCQKYDEHTNNEESCRHHPGEPFFHDAYKGWSCCNKKCTDFTEFLNIKGCKLAKHCNVKPPEPEKPVVDTTEVVEVKPLITTRLERPNFNTEMVLLKPTVAASLLSCANVDKVASTPKSDNSKIVHVGTTCKNPGCGMVYDGEDSHTTECVYHPGVPIFHEGLKFWSCCQKRTTDFTAFMNQVGCENGQHVWIKEEKVSNQVDCRWDHHQTASHVVLSIYAKNYCPKQSTFELNPIRLKVNVVFPQQDNATFCLDLELKGVIIVETSSVQMFGTKIEIKMRKAEAGTWSRIDIQPVKEQLSNKPSDVNNMAVDNVTDKVDAVDLSDL